MASQSAPCTPSAIPAEGLTVLKVPQEEVSVDIIFVHGFTGHPHLTWRHKHGTQCPQPQVPAEEDSEPPTKSRKLYPFSKPQDACPLYWPTDLLPATVPSARIMTYGYDTRIRHKIIGPPPSRNNVYDIAWNMLVEIEAVRRSSPERPLLFIAHSLGGIVVKETLRRSTGCGPGKDHLRQIASSTIGVIFFGTPHSGADPRGILLRTAETLGRVLGMTVNKQVVDSLLPSSERLQQLRDEFGPMAQEAGWVIHSFQEQFGAKVMGGSKVVEDTSSCLNYPVVEITQHIASNHMDMCRFTGCGDAEYRKVEAALDRIIQASQQRPHRGAYEDGSAPCLDPQQRTELLVSLQFEGMGDRQVEIERAHSKTCQWFLNQTEYKDWLDTSKMTEHHGVLWIKGNPGTGKSTIIKYLLEQAKSSSFRPRGGGEPIKIISFFFNARSSEKLEKSTAGMYRYLLLQLLKKASNKTWTCLWNVLDLPDPKNATRLRWTINRLKDLFQAAVLEEGFRITCFIDALDECDEFEIRDMLSFFSTLGELSLVKGGFFRVCFSSRHYPHVTINRGISLTLEGQEGHTRDIIDYLSIELHIGNSKIAKTVRSDMLKKASGIFMWVVLVTQILNKEFDDGNIHTLPMKLREIPSDLHELFGRILGRDDRNAEQMLLCIQWLLFSERRLRPEELYFAILSMRHAMEYPANKRWDREEITPEDIKKFITSTSKGLVEITSTTLPRAQFIHESVRDYLLRDGGLYKVWPNIGESAVGRGHDALKICCLNYVLPESLELGRSPRPLLTAVVTEDYRINRKHLYADHPFLEYALEHMLYHSNLAQADGVSQYEFLTSELPLPLWIEVDNYSLKCKERQYHTSVEWVYILAEKNCANLIKALGPIDLLSEFRNSTAIENSKTERYRTPILTAIAHGAHDAIGQLLLSDPELSRFANSSLTNAILSAGHPRHSGTRQNLSLKYSRGKTLLSYLVEYGHPPFVALVLEIDSLQPGINDDYYTIIKERALEYQDDMVRTLLSGRPSRTPISIQASYSLLLDSLLNGRVKVVQQLLQCGIRFGIYPNHHVLPRRFRSISEWAGSVRLLVEGGYNLESTDPDGFTLLYYAASCLINEGKHKVNPKRDYFGARHKQRVYQRVIEDCVASGANVDHRRPNGATPLVAAVEDGGPELVGLLLENGANPNGALASAICSRRLRFSPGGMLHKIRLLLEHGADVNSRGAYGACPLHLVISRGLSHEFARLLLEHGADINSRDAYGVCPLHLARSPADVDLLVAHGADIEARDVAGFTPLMSSLSFGGSGCLQPSVIQALLMAGADVEAKTSCGKTALQLAEETSQSGLHLELLRAWSGWR